MWSTGKSASLRPPSPQKPPSTPDSQVVTTTASSSVATAASGSTSTRVPLSAVAPEGAHSGIDTDTHAPPLGDVTTASTSVVPPAWKTTHRTTLGMENIYVACYSLFPFFLSAVGCRYIIVETGSLLIGLLCVVRSCSRHSMVAARFALEWSGSVTSFKNI